MMKLIIGILIGIALVGSLFIGPFTSTSASSQSGESSESYLPDAYPGLYKDDIADTLKQAGAEINDKDIAEFYQLLVDQYNLANNVTARNDLYPLPDINRIVRQATSLPLQETGKNIKNEDIARFYNDFLEDAGWEFD